MVANANTATAVLLGAFAELRKATVGFVVSTCLSSVRMEQLGSRRTDFHEI